MTRARKRASVRRGGGWLLQLAWLAAFLLPTVPLASSSILHAMEPAQCIDMRDAVQMGHVLDDVDQVPADGGKNYAHHHGGCHGHQLFEVWPSTPFTIYTRGRSEPMIGATAVFASTESGPSLRPPIA